MNITTLFLATLTAVSVNTASEPSPPEQPIEPTLTLLDGECVSPVTVEDYVIGCIMHEVPYTFESEAVKAQAVAARTYLYYCLENTSNPHNGADVCTDISHCMGYITANEYAARYGEQAAQKAYEAASRAAVGTCGEILTYNGVAALSVWHASSDGYTEDSGDVWLESLPYLASVSSPEAAEITSVSFSEAEVRALLEAAGLEYSGISLVKQTKTPSGRCKTLVIGRLPLDGKAVRSLFSLKSTDFTASSQNGRLTFTVRGYGHGVGMSQHGANAMAKAGYSYRDILSHYYSGTVIT